MAQKWPTPVPVNRSLRQVGDHVATWRKLQGLTAAQLAERAGISRGTLRRLETGEGAISLENTLRAVRVLGMLDGFTESLDPMRTDVGRLRAEEVLPRRVRSKSNRGLSGE